MSMQTISNNDYNLLLYYQYIMILIKISMLDKYEIEALTLN